MECRASSFCSFSESQLLISKHFLYTISFNLHHSLGGRYYHYLETEGKEEQRGPVTHPRSHSLKMEEAGFSSCLASVFGPQCRQSPRVGGRRKRLSGFRRLSGPMSGGLWRMSHLCPCCRAFMSAHGRGHAVHRTSCAGILVLPLTAPQPPQLSKGEMALVAHRAPWKGYWLVTWGSVQYIASAQ